MRPYGYFSSHRRRLYAELGSECLFCASDSSNRKRELLSREDLELSWRPLYELHDRILFSKTEHLGLNWFPKYASVLYCRRYYYCLFQKACSIIAFRKSPWAHPMRRAHSPHLNCTLLLDVWYIRTSLTELLQCLYLI